MATSEADPAVESTAWVARLSAAGPERDLALAELHALLLRAARYTIAQKRALLPQLGSAGLDELALEAADDAALEVLAHLDDFRGESRFTTWAWKFAFYEASVAVRKRRWLGREVPAEAGAWDRLEAPGSPDGALEQAELLAALQHGVETALTPHQRSVFVALALNEVPIDVLAERLGTSRGALYKTLHDARGRLRSHLDARGLRPDGWQEPVERPGRRLPRAATPTA
jgi:RNA polymerase sigma-70 factor (ECF subfamily)